MDILLIILAVLCALIGLAGTVAPVIPGTPLSYGALLLLHFTKGITYSEKFLIIMAIIAVVITLIDFWIPIYGTKKFGGTKAGVRGSMVGLIIGVFVLPFLGIVIGPFGLLGIILGPFLGALVGERMAGTPEKDAFRSAIGSFLGFVAGTLIKVIYGLVVLFYVIKDIFVLIAG
ncbi:MAG: DUF456 domain-containing protein [Bacteroidia bacterium]|nr:DUF456 domain-containing protein [Bacteroidia bacterium]